MLKHGKFMLAVAALVIAGATLIAAGSKLPGGLDMGVKSNAAAGVDPQTTTGPSPPSNPSQASKIAAAEEYTKRLLLLMDTDKNGRVSKQEFMDFMAKVFDQLDTNHDGQLDVKELAKFRERPWAGK